TLFKLRTFAPSAQTPPPAPLPRSSRTVGPPSPSVSPPCLGSNPARARARLSPTPDPASPQTPTSVDPLVRSCFFPQHHSTSSAAKLSLIPYDRLSVHLPLVLRLALLLRQPSPKSAHRLLTQLLNSTDQILTDRYPIRVRQRVVTRRKLLQRLHRVRAEIPASPVRPLVRPLGKVHVPTSR